jgi:HAE1 family hydrophobic/amphiphilic exporter-1
VTASTLTTVAVFLPIVFLSGIAGDFFSPFAITVVVALLASLVVAVMVVPLVASRFIPRPRKVVADAARGLMQRVYVPTVRWALAHRLLTVLVAILLLAGSFALVPRLRVNLLDQSGGSTFMVSLAMGKGATLQQTDEQTMAIENLIKGVGGVSAYQAVVGTVLDPFAPPGTVPPDPTTASVTVVLADNADYTTVSNDVQRLIKQDYHGPALVQVEGASAAGTNSQITETVQNGDLQKLQTATNQVVGAFNSIHGLSQVTSNLAADQPQINLVPTAQLASSGLNLQQLASVVSSAVSGTVAAQARLPQGTVAVSVVLPPGTADTPQALGVLPVPTQHGVVPLSSLVTLEQVNGPTSIDRSGNTQAATVTATITGDNQSAIQREVTSKLNGLSLPSGTTLGNAGTLADLSTVLRQFELAILAAIGLVYLIMVATFRSFLKPFVLLFSIPFAAIGAIVALTVTKTALSLPSLVGLLMLVGIVVTNAIVLLDLVEQYRDRGLPLHDALIEGGRRRLRPILMTAVATVLALTPLAVSGNSSGGGFISAPLAIVVIGGLVSSTLLTLVLIPVLYSLVSRFTGARRNREQEALLEAGTAGSDIHLPATAPVAAAGAVVAISAAPGIPAAPVAARVAEDLGLPLHDLSSRLDGWIGAVDSVLGDEHHSPRWLERLAGRLDSGDGAARQPITPGWLLGSSLDLMTAGSGGVIVSPLAAQALGGGRAFRVRLEATVERRAQLARVDGEPLSVTQARLRDQDAEQEAAISGMYGVDARPTYDLTLDPTALSSERVAALIVAAVPGVRTEAVEGARPAPATAG